MMRFSNPLAKLLATVVLAACAAMPAHAASDLFSDEFDKPFLDDAWQIRKDSADMRALDSGRLAVVTQPGRLSQDTAKNLLMLRDDLTEKNADVRATLRVDFQEYGTNWDYRSLGGIMLYRSKDEYLILYIVNYRAGYKSDSGPHVFFAKRHNGNVPPTLSRRLLGMKQGPVEYHLRLEKRNYKYTAYASLDGRKWRRVGTFGVLDKSFRPGLFAVRGPKAAEAIFEFDRIAVTKAD